MEKIVFFFFNVSRWWTKCMSNIKCAFLDEWKCGIKFHMRFPDVAIFPRFPPKFYKTATLMNGRVFNEFPMGRERERENG